MHNDRALNIRQPFAEYKVKVGWKLFGKTSSTINAGQNHYCMASDEVLLILHSGHTPLTNTWSQILFPPLFSR